MELVRGDAPGKAGTTLAVNSFGLRRFRLALQVRQRTPADISEFAERGLAAAGCLDQLLRDEFTTPVVPPIGKLRADLLQYDIHIGLNAIVEFGHLPISRCLFQLMPSP